MRYIQSFSTSGTEQEAIDNLLLGKPYVAFIEDGRYIDWNTKNRTVVDYSTIPLTFDIISGGTINIRGYSSWFDNNTIYYSTDDGQTWGTLSPTAAGTSVNVNAGDKLILKGNNASYGRSNGGCMFANSTAVFSIYGNIMSLIDADNFSTLKTLTGEYNFYLMFGAAKIVSIENMVLPATALTTGCYQGMFESCTGITTAPELPASVLPAYSYKEMFYGCTKLNKVKALATDMSANSCITGWLNNVSSTGTFVKHPNATWPSGSSGIPDGWTVVDADI